MSGMRSVQLYLSTEHACGYLPDQTARNAYVDPALKMTRQRYGWLIAQGFRRSGDYVYRPYCAQCLQCVPARVPVSGFVANRSQKRCLTRNADLSLRAVLELDDEHYALYRRYISARHSGQGMDADNREAFQSFLQCSWGDAQFWEFREDQRLVAVAVVDALPAALSAVYTFFDPADSARSLGTYAVLQQIAAAQKQGREHVYLGYWVAESRKMDYKKNFRPLELLRGEVWTRRELSSALG
jgi:arginyl-tRNA--protein-N-Asp/Glu arginylyltransferase